MTITVNTKAYVADVASSPNSIPYKGPGATLSNLDQFDLYRTTPKPTKEFSGMARSRVKLSRTLTLTGALTSKGPLTIDVQINVPVGASGTDVDDALDDIAAGLAQTWAQELAKNLDLTA